MFDWLKNMLAKPILPFLEQGYRVVLLIQPAIEEFINKAVDLGITPGSPLHTTITNVASAIAAIENVLHKTIIFLGGSISSLAAVSSNSLSLELDKLKFMLSAK